MSSTVNWSEVANQSPLNLLSSSLPQSRLAWVTPSTRSHSGLAPPTRLSATICWDVPPRPRSSCTGGDELCFSQSVRNRHDHQINRNFQPTQSTLRPSAVWFCHRVCVIGLLFFFCCNMLMSQGVARSPRSPSLSVSWGVSTVSVDTKCRLKCCACHDVYNMMGYHIQFVYCYMIIKCVLSVYRNIFKPLLMVNGFKMQLFTNIGGGKT